MDKIRISEIVSSIEIRPVEPWGVALIADSIKTNGGFLEDHPILVCEVEGGYEVIDGNHRVKAAKLLGLERIPAEFAEFSSYEEKLKRAVSGNNAAETMIPTNFPDHAERIWRWAEDGLTQQQIAEVQGWSREKVKDYVALKNICKGAWSVIGATFRLAEKNCTEDHAPTSGAIAPFTEGLLRDIISLQPHQQYELVEGLATGKIQKGRFKTLAAAYKARNAATDWLYEKLAGLDEPLIWEAVDEIEKGKYDSEWLGATIGKKKKGKASTDEEGALPGLGKLVQAARDKWEKKTSLRLIHGDFYDEIKNIPNESVDLIITDPPYNIANDRIFGFENRSDISQNFGEWDKFSKEDFIEKIKIWVSEFKRILKPTGSVYIFCTQRFSSYIEDEIDQCEMFDRVPLVWVKTNPSPQVVKRSHRSAFEMILFFTKDESQFTFNWQGENEMLNWIKTPICQGNERLKDEKGNTLHPTQKPEQVIRHLMEISSNKGDVVFDGFMGVGTTAKVARDLDRKFIGIEKEKKFFDAASERLSK